MYNTNKFTNSDFVLEQLLPILETDMCLLGIDYGKKRIGIAISDIDQKIAFPLKTVENNKPIKILKKIIESEKVTTIVVGVPINLDGSNTDATEMCFKFHLKLKNLSGKLNK